MAVDDGGGGSSNSYTLAGLLDTRSVGISTVKTQLRGSKVWLGCVFTADVPTDLVSSRPARV